jgi:hypothetical protein
LAFDADSKVAYETLEYYRSSNFSRWSKIKYLLRRANILLVK